MLDRLEHHVGDPASVLDLPALQAPWLFAVVGNELYYGRSAGEYECDVFKVRFDGGQPQRVASLPSNAGLTVVGGSIFGVANWGRLRISRSNGWVYEVEPDKACASGDMKDGAVRKFRGLYRWLSFDADSLWAGATDGRVFRLDLDAPP
jgi:hypothetical protein